MYDIKIKMRNRQLDYVNHLSSLIKQQYKSTREHVTSIPHPSSLSKSFAMTSLLLPVLVSAFLVSTAVPNYNTADVRRVATITNRYGDDLLDSLGSEEGNIFFSPVSISTVLSALYVGARGYTHQELGRIGFNELERKGVVVPRSFQELFGILQDTSDEYQLETANVLITQEDYPILKQYKDTFRSSYGEIKEVNFIAENDKAVQEVNDWVNEKTNGKIDKLLDELDPSTRLVLLNAIYFKGTWQTEFDPENTKQEPFYNNGNNVPKKVPIMHTESKYPYLYDEENQLRALMLPYKGNDISMVVLLPMERDGVERIQREVSSDELYSIIERMKEESVKVSIPKFKLEYQRYLKDDIRETGVHSLFDTRADLSGITGNRDLYVSEIIHKAVIEVNEEGSEAAAVTGGIAVLTSLELPEDKYVFEANHPFLFYIVDHRTNTNLFVGRVSDL